MDDDGIEVRYIYTITLMLCALPVLGQNFDNIYCSNGVPTWGAADGPAALPSTCYNNLLSNTPAPGAVVNVTANSATDLQNKLTTAVCGQRITLPAGSVYSGNFTLPAIVCASSNYLWIVTSGLASLPAEGTRTSPCYSGVTSLPNRPSYACPGTPGTYTAKIITLNSTAALTFTAGTSSVRIIGVEVTRTPGTGLVAELVKLGNLGSIDHIIFDRVWMHGDELQDETESAINTSAVSYVAVVDSYFHNFQCIASIGACTDSHAIVGALNHTNSTQETTHKIVNNFIESSGENFFYGGGSAFVTPSGIEVRLNSMFKNPCWYPNAVCYDGGVGGNAYIAKNLFELKNADRVFLEGNTFQNNWSGFSQGGECWAITPVNQSGNAPTAVITNFVARYNTCNSVNFFVELDMALNGGFIAAGQNHYSIHDNVVDNLGYCQTMTGTLPSCPTSNPTVQMSFYYLATAAQTQHDVSVNHNTLVYSINSGTVSAALGLSSPTIASGNNAYNEVFTNNVTRAWGGTLNDMGGSQPLNCADSQTSGVNMINACWTNYTFTGNCFVNNGSITWPAGNITSVTGYATALINYNNGNAGDYHIAVGACKGAATDGLDPGANIAVLNSVLAGNVAPGTFPANFFGAHYNNTLSLYPPNPTISWPTIRLWDTKTGWADMQTGPNCKHTMTTDCNFSRLDTWLSKFNSPRAKLILTLAKTPNFIASNTSDTNCGYTNALGNPNGSCTPPTDVNCDGTGTDATWIGFVTAIWDHLAATGNLGRINYLEIWNEWNVPTFYDITYINSTKCPGVTNAAHKILTRLEQDARCILKTAGTTTCNAGGTYPVKGAENAVAILSPPLPGPGNSNNQIKTNGAEDKLLSVGGGNYADYISIHAYMNSKGNTVPANCGAAPANAGCMWPENLVSLITQLNTLQNSYSLNLPMIISEGSWGAQSNTTDPQFEQAYVARYITLMLQYGVQVFPWYNVDGGNVTLPVLYANNTSGILTTGGAAYQTIESWLMNKTFISNQCTVTPQAGCSGGASSNTYECALTTGERVVWYDEVADNAACSYTNTAGFGTYFTMNNTVLPISGPITLDNRPILLEPSIITSPTNLKITPGVKLMPGIILTKEDYEKNIFADLTAIPAGKH